MLSEGDSWFAFPKELRPSAIDVLEKTLDLVLMRLEKDGDEVSAMLSAQRKLLEYDLGKLPFDVLLFSGGGNDIVGDDLYPLLHTVDGDYTWEDVVNTKSWRRIYAGEKGFYWELIAIRDRLRPECWIITHCYDYPIPNEAGFIKCLNQIIVGPWLYGPMAGKGIMNRDVQRAVTPHLIQLHRRLLQELEEEYPPLSWWIPSVL